MISLCFSVLILMIAMPVLAGVYYKGEQGFLDNSRLILSLGGGGAFTSDAGRSKTFSIDDPVTDEEYHYHADDEDRFVSFFNAFLGGEWHLTRSFDVQAGLSYYYLGNLKAEGTLTQGADAQSADEYDYQYHIQSQQLLLESKWLYVYRLFHPYVSFGIGEAFNSATDYKVIYPQFLTFTRLFDDDTTRSFTYNIGFGLDYDISPCARVGIGYRFTDLGKVSLGHAVIDTTNVSGKLSQSHLYVNEVLAQFTLVL